MIISELAEYDMKKWIYTENFYNYTVIYDAMFQILSGLYALHKYGNITHLDLHGGNILVTKITPGYLYEYNINNVSYYNRENGYLFRLWDFGRSEFLIEKNREKLQKIITRQAERFYPNEIKNKIYFSNYSFSNFHAFDVWRISSYLLHHFNELDEDQKILKFLNYIKKYTKKIWFDNLFTKNKIEYNIYDLFPLLYSSSKFENKIKIKNNKIEENLKNYLDNNKLSSVSTSLLNSKPNDIYIM